MGFKLRYIKIMSAKSATIILNLENMTSIIIINYLKFDFGCIYWIPIKMNVLFRRSIYKSGINNIHMVYMHDIN